MGDSCPGSQPSPSSSGSGVLLSAVAGAVLGAAGLAWWLLSAAERRRLETRQSRLLRLSRLQDGSDGAEPPGRSTRSGSADGQDRQLHDKVQELNQAIDEVRRQLEAMATAR